MDDIAVIGMGCRVPGADNTDEFWRVLLNGENHITDIPKERWNNDAFYSKDQDEPGKSYVRKAGFLNGYDEWDNKLFGISESEAARIDPQQRLALECTHMALEDAGITRKQLKGSQTSVYMGVMNDDYKSLYMFDHDEDTSFSATGTSWTLISARVSYVFDLRGPSMVVDTACSSSMAAIHLGSQSIRSGECEMAICGGVNCILSPDQFITLCKSKMLSPSGQCQSFCDTADGYGRGEGCGVVILKSYKKALKDKNKIWGIVKTGSNQDGQMAKPITAPSGEQQEELLKKVYSLYDIDPVSLQYIEAHGTGTPVGDPTEINAIGRFIQSYGLKVPNGKQNDTNNCYMLENDFQNSQRMRDNQIENNVTVQNKAKETILIGSVKSNIGHLESAAGVVSLIKVLLMMNERKFVPSLHVKKDKSNVNKKINLETSGLGICTEVSEWKPDTNGKRVCCVNCFGFGGSNMHAVVIQQDIKEHPYNHADNQYKVVCTSGLNIADLKIQMQTLNRDLATGGYKAQDISFTSVFHRDHFRYKTSVFGKTLEEIQKQLTMKLSEVDKIQTEKQIRIIFVFCGVGTTWKGMCREMMQQTVFRETIDRVDNQLKSLTSLSIAEKFVNDTDYNDPFLNHVGLFCVQIGLFEQWRRWGIQPKAIIGQSVGEVAAAYGSGALSLDDAIQIIYTRSKILSEFTGGKMITARNISKETVERLSQKYKNRANVAVYNSPVSYTFSGDSDAIEQLTIDLENLKILTRPVSVPCAYHSHQMEEAAKLTESELKILKPGIRITEQFSTVTGELAKKNDFQTAKYWANNIRQPVLFMNAVKQSLDEHALNVFVEIGPKQVLHQHLPNIVDTTKEWICLPSMNVNNECESMYTSLNTLYELGANVTWENIIPFDGKRVPLPRYIFQKKKMLHIPRQNKLLLKGVRQISGSHMYTRQSHRCGKSFTVHLGKETTPFVYDHYMNNVILVPGSTYIEAAFEIGRQVSSLCVFDISVSVEFLNTCIPKHNEHCLIDVTVEERGLNNYEFYMEKDKKVLCKGHICPRTESERQQINIQAIKERCETHRTKEESYRCLDHLHFQYGESLRIVEQSWSSAVECIAEFTLTESVLEQRKVTQMHPSVIDGMFQTCGILSKTDYNQLTLPKSLASIVMNKFPEKCMYGYSYLERSTATENHFNILLLSQSGNVLAEMRNFFAKLMSDESEMSSNIMYKSVWRDLPSPIEVPEDSSGNDMHCKIIGHKRFISWFEKLNDHSNELIHIENRDLSKEPFSNILRFRSIVYAPSVHIQDCQHGGSLVYQCVKESFKNLAHIIRHLSQLDKELPVFIVTEKAMIHQHDNESDLNVCGSELWGMARSAISEGAYSNLILVDMAFSKANIIALKKLLKRKPHGYNEFMIKDGKYHYLEIIETNADDIPFRRQMNNDMAKDTILKSSSATILSDPFYDATTPEFTTNCKAHQYEIQLKRFCLHNSSVYPVSYPDASNEDMYRTGTNTGYTFICIEGTGRIHDKTEENSSLADVAFCCPVYVSPVVSVPKECVYDLTSLPVYIPGMLTVGVLLWNVVEACTELSSENIFVIVDDDYEVRIKLIRTILSDQHLSPKIVSKRQLLNMQPSGDKDTVIILAHLNMRQFSEVEKIFPALKHMISVDGYISKRQKIYMNMNKEMVSLRILSVEDMFTYSELTAKIPKIYKCFGAFSCEKESLLEGKRVSKKNLLDLPYVVFPLYDENGKPNIPLKVTKENVLRQNGCYIIVGGLSGLGWELLQLLVRLGATYIATLSRRSLTDQITKDIKQIEAKYECVIINLQGDITKQDQVTAAFEKLKSQLDSHVDIRGIFHGAGVIRDNFLRDMQEKDLDEVMLPKVLGTWNLHQASLSLPLDFFIMHSSIASVFGNQKQCNYAAGNSFQDSFAHFRRSLGLCGQSINWGPLPLGMTKKDLRLETHLKTQGFQFLTKENICDCFIAALMTNEIQLMFGKFDWVKLQENAMFKLNSNKFADILKMNPTSETDNEESDATKFRCDFFKQDPTEQSQMVHELVWRKIAKSFAFDESTLTGKTTMVKLGIDSLSAMNFTNDIYQITKTKIPLLTLYNGSTTLEDITSLIVKKMLEEPEVVEAETEQPDENVCNYLEGEVTFMQKTLLDDVAKYQFSRNIMRQVEFEISGLELNKNDLEIIFIHLIYINPELRRTFAGKEKKYHPIVRESQQISFNIEEVEFNSICVENSIDKREEVRMDIRKEIPIRVKVAFRQRRTRVRMFIHAVVGDLAGITNLVRDIGAILKCHLKQQSLPPVKTNLNLSKVLRDSITPQSNKLKRFWSSYLNADISPFTFSTDLDEEIEEEYWKDISERVPPYLYDKMMKFINSQGISLYNFLFSVYTIVLHEFTGKFIIPLVTWIDMRAHVQQLQPVIQSCSNAVPVVGDLREMDQVKTYLKKRSDQLYDITQQYSAYPYELIKEEMKSEELKMHIGRHRFIMENMTNLNNVSRYEDFELKIGRPYYKRHSYETSLHIEYDTHSNYVDLQFGYNKKLVAETYASQVLPRMVQLMEEMEQSPDTQVIQLLKYSKRFCGSDSETSST